MTFATLEASQQGSSPVELYEFTQQGITYYYTTADADQVVNDITYANLALSRTELNTSTEIGKNNLTITGPDSYEIPELYGAGPPDDVVTLIIKRVQANAEDLADITIVWIGRVTSVDWPPLRSELHCESVYTSMRIGGLRRQYTINCPYALYGSECTVDIISYQSTLTATQAGNVLTSSTLGSEAAGWWAGGKVIWEYSPGLYAKRGVKNSSGNTAETTFAFAGFPSGGATVTIAPGCDHTYGTCITKFSNGNQFGGFPFMTQKNPFGSASVF
jgi:uncharacterized phage protein (TIGR02218 family)